MKILLIILLSPVISAAPIQNLGEAIVYKKTEQQELNLYVLKPDDWKPSDTRPAIVWFYGGGWVGGAPGQFEPQAKHFAKLGFVCILPEYRLIKIIPGPPVFPCRDAKSAMRWTRSHAVELGINPEKIAAAGGSAGGHLAAFTGLVDGMDDPADDLKISAKPAALLLFNPVLDNGKGEWGSERVGEKTKEFSPAHNVTKEAPPAIVFLGTKDKLIPVSTLERFQKNMKSAGVRCDLHLYEGKGHGFFNKDPERADTIAKSEAFLRDLGWLKQGSPDTSVGGGIGN